MKADLYNLENEVIGKVELPDTVFAAPWRPALVQQVLLAQQANRRLPWAHAKGRGEVRGGGKKPWRQKGTGRARHGSIRSPLWIGGGKAHGPNSERDYSQKVNKKMKRIALLSALSKKFAAHAIKIVNDLSLPEPKTKHAARAMAHLISAPKNRKKAGSAELLFVPAIDNGSLFRAASNLKTAKVLGAASLNVEDILKYKHVVIDEKAIPAIAAVYETKKK